MKTILKYRLCKDIFKAISFYFLVLQAFTNKLLYFFEIKIFGGNFILFFRFFIVNQISLQDYLFLKSKKKIKKTNKGNFPKLNKILILQIKKFLIL